MAGLGNRVAVLTVSRLASFGLMFIGPVIVARLLSAHDFGRYREFLLYGSILQSFGAFFIRDSLLYFIPAHPQSPWRVVRQTTWLTACTSGLTVVLLYVGDRATGGAIVGEYLYPLIAYTLLSINLDFWEYYWIARQRAAAVFLYSASRLLARLLVVAVAALLTHDVAIIIWALVALEAARLVVSAVVLFALDKSREEPPVPNLLRTQLQYCLPTGSASLLSMGSRNLSNVVVANVLGAVALGRYAIGRFSEPVVLAVRSSLTAVILSEMVRRDRQAKGPSLVLWKQATIVNLIFLFPFAVLVARYAEPLVEMLFGERYRAAAPIMQLYMLVVVRECFDFSPALRAVNRTQPLIASNLISLITCAAALAVLIPLAGLPGAMLAFVIASFADASYLGWRVCKVYNVSWRDLLPWAALGQTAAAAALASIALLSNVWTETFGVAGILFAGTLYALAYVIVLLWMRVPEAELLLNWVLRTIRRKRASWST